MVGGYEALLTGNALEDSGERRRGRSFVDRPSGGAARTWRWRGAATGRRRSLHSWPPKAGIAARGRPCSPRPPCRPAIGNGVAALLGIDFFGQVEHGRRPALGHLLDELRHRVATGPRPRPVASRARRRWCLAVAVIEDQRGAPKRRPSFFARAPTRAPGPARTTWGRRPGLPAATSAAAGAAAVGAGASAAATSAGAGAAATGAGAGAASTGAGASAAATSAGASAAATSAAAASAAATSAGASAAATSAGASASANSAIGTVPVTGAPLIHLDFDFYVLVGEEPGHAAPPDAGGTDDPGRGPRPAPRRIDGFFKAGSLKL